MTKGKDYILSPSYSGTYVKKENISGIEILYFKMHQPNRFHTRGGLTMFHHATVKDCPEGIASHLIQNWIPHSNN